MNPDGVDFSMALASFPVVDATPFGKGFVV